MTYSGKGEATEVIEASVVARGLGEGGMHRWGTEDSQSSDNTVYDTTMWDECHYTFAQTHERTTPRGTLNVNSGPWVTVTGPHRFTDRNKGTTPVGRQGLYG